MEPKMTLGEVASLLEGYGASLLPAEKNTSLYGATSDSRKVRPGDLFCAIHGAETDGNRFIDDAIARGAYAVMTDDPDAEAFVPVLRVRPGTGYHAISRVAEAMAGYPARRLKLVGITGTCGKTTTAFLTRDLLRAGGFRTGMIGTVVYDLGNGEELHADRTTPPPFELQELFSRLAANGVEYVVMECSSAALDQERSGSALFSAAAFTNFSRDHLDYHGSMEAYLDSKKKLFMEFLAPNATAVVNVDDSTGRELAGELRGSRHVVPLSLANAESPWKTPLPGAFNQYNATCAGLLARALGVPDEVVAEVLSKTGGAPGRLQRIECPNGAVAFVDYAHTPEEISCALDALREECPGRLGILFGCGGDRDRGKRPMMAQAAAKADFVWITSDNPRTEDPLAILADVRSGMPAGCQWCEEPDRAQAIRMALSACRPGDWLLVAGKGHEDYQEINHVKHPFSDCEAVRAFIQSSQSPETP